MASEQAQSSPERRSFIENLINSRNRDISLFLPFILGLNAAPESDGGRPDRIVLINPFTQGMVVIERSGGGGGDSSSEGFESLLDELLSRKSGRPPASKAAIDAMESVEVVSGEDGSDPCAICLEEWEAGGKAKRMPCRHRFHGECIEKWLNIHGSCPVCRYEMPVDETEDEKKRSGGGGGERRRGIWVSFTFGSERRRGATERTSDDDDVSSERTSDDDNVSL